MVIKNIVLDIQNTIISLIKDGSNKNNGMLLMKKAIKREIVRLKNTFVRYSLIERSQFFFANNNKIVPFINSKTKYTIYNVGAGNPYLYNNQLINNGKNRAGALNNSNFLIFPTALMVVRKMLNCCSKLFE